MRAATVADQAGSAADYWSIHDLLYTGGPLDENTILRARYALNHGGARPLAEGTASDAVQAAMDEATALGIRGTPTFVLICPSGVVRRIASLDQVTTLASPGCDSSSQCSPGAQ
jgi:protein-disulfide isomerase